MPRLYTVSFKFVTVSDAQDLIALKGSTGKTCKVKRFYLKGNDTTLQTAQMLRLNVKYASATLTLGSGGSVPTPRPLDPGDAAASFSCHVNDTTPSTTSGAFTDLFPGGGHNFQGDDLALPVEQLPGFGLNEGVVYELLSTVSGTCNFSGFAIVEETGS